MALRVRPLPDEERMKLERITQAQTAPVRLARRARMVERAATGMTVPGIAAQVKRRAQWVRQWRARFNQAGLEGLDDAMPPARDDRAPAGKTRTVA